MVLHQLVFLAVRFCGALLFWHLIGAALPTDNFRPAVMDRRSDHNNSSSFDDDIYEYDHQEIADLFWGNKVTRRYVDRITFAEKRDVVGYPRIEDSSYETTDLALSQPRIPLLPTRKTQDDHERKEKTTTSGSNKKDGSGSSSGGSRKSTTLSSEQQQRSTSLPANQSTSRSNRKSKSPVRNNYQPPSNRTKKSPTSKQKSKTSSDTSLGAFLQRNKGEQIMKQEAAKILMGNPSGLDQKSIGSCRSMASMSVSDRSYAERSKTEESLARRTKERQAVEARNKVDGNFAGSLIHEDQGMTIMSIDEMSTTDFSGHARTSKSSTHTTLSPEKLSKNASLDGFLSKQQQDPIPESTNDGSNHQRDTADAVSVVSASTLGCISVSARSKAEQSASEKKMRQKRKKKKKKELATGKTLTEEEEEDDADIINDQMIIPCDTNGHVEEETGEGNNCLDDSLDLVDVVVPRVEKNLRFRDGHSERYISQEITNSMYDDLFYTSEELAEFRYEAFMEEAGLDINEFS
jgi:hypothetical protein